MDHTPDHGTLMQITGYLTDQRFESFDAMRNNVAPFGYRSSLDLRRVFGERSHGTHLRMGLPSSETLRPRSCDRD
ncbi:MAG: hypothetical protein IPP83_12645 [Flavobacteriales bacterium]|nr:hypothetical protein [Flavobacteriales bacterium]